MTSSGKLPLLATFIRAALALWQQRRNLASNVSVPLLAWILSRSLLHWAEDTQRLTLYLLLYSGVAVCLVFSTIHRLLLTPDVPIPGLWGVYWTRREWKWLGSVAAVGAFFSLAASPALLLQKWFWQLDSSAPSVEQVDAFLWGKTLLFTVAAWGAFRLFLALPGASIGAKKTFLTAWRASQGYAFRLLLVFQLPALIRGLVDSVSYGIPGGSLVLEVVSVGCLVFGAALLSTAYRQLIHSDSLAGTEDPPLRGLSGKTPDLLMALALSLSLGLSAWETRARLHQSASLVFRLDEVLAAEKKCSEGRRAIAQNQIEADLALFHEGIRIQKELHVTRVVSSSYLELGEVHRSLGDKVAARLSYLDAEKSALSIRDNALLSESRQALRQLGRSQ